MNSFTSLLKNRRSTRKFTSRLLSPEQVEAILKAALMAPSSKHVNPWQFVAVEDREVLQKLALCKQHGAAFIAECALAVVVLGCEAESDAWIEDASIASIFMQLQAEDLGLGSCWCHVRNRTVAPGADLSAHYIRTLLGIPGHLEVLCVIAFGHKDQEHKPLDESRLQWEKVHTEVYQNKHQ